MAMVLKEEHRRKLFAGGGVVSVRVSARPGSYDHHYANAAKKWSGAGTVSMFRRDSRLLIVPRRGLPVHAGGRHPAAGVSPPRDKKIRHGAVEEARRQCQGAR